MSLILSHCVQKYMLATPFYQYKFFNSKLSNFNSPPRERLSHQFLHIYHLVTITLGMMKEDQKYKIQQRTGKTYTLQQQYTNIICSFNFTGRSNYATNYIMWEFHYRNKTNVVISYFIEPSQTSLIIFNLLNKY